MADLKSFRSYKSSRVRSDSSGAAVAGIALSALYLLLQAGDVLTTRVFLDMGMAEGNPLAQWLFDTLGFWTTALTVKPLGAALVVAMTWRSPFLISVNVCIMAGVVAGNVCAILVGP